MANRFTVANLCELALQKIGEMSTYDTAADPVAMERARRWMDLVVARKTGSLRLDFLVRSDLRFALTAGTMTYNIADTLASAAPTDGIDHVLSARLLNAETGRTIRELDMLGRDEWDAIALHDQDGEPTCCFIDSAVSPNISFYRQPEEAGVYLASLSVQSFSDNVSTLASGAAFVDGLRTSWQMWCVLATAAELGDGPVRRLASDEVRNLKTGAEEAWRELMSYAARENKPRGGGQITAHWF